MPYGHYYLNFALEYAIRRVQDTKLGLDMNDTHQELTYADDVNLLGDDIRNQPSTTYLAFGKYLKRSGSTIRMYVSYL